MGQGKKCLSEQMAAGNNRAMMFHPEQKKFPENINNNQTGSLLYHGTTIWKKYHSVIASEQSPYTITLII